MYTGNAMKTDIRPSLLAALTCHNFFSCKHLRGSFGRQAIVRGRIIMPFTVYNTLRIRHRMAARNRHPASTSPTGLEPVTFGFGGQRSIQLGYGDNTFTVFHIKNEPKSFPSAVSS